MGDENNANSLPVKLGYMLKPGVRLLRDEAMLVDRPTRESQKSKKAASSLMKAMKSKWGNSINRKFPQAAKDSKMGDSDDTPSAADFTKFCKGIKTSLEERRRDFGENPSTRT
jgi:hypothetical protein